MVALVILSVLSVLILSVAVFLQSPRFGRLPRGERQARIERSPNYREGQFRNRQSLPQFTSDKGVFGSLVAFLTDKNPGLRPRTDLPVAKTDLSALDRETDWLVWFGHSSYLLQLAGRRILVDPVFRMASPVSFVNRPFKGTDIYSPDDMPDIDYLVITHDHWDHLDYRTVTELKPRIGKVICALGVGEHFERWGFSPDRIIELDWDEDARLDSLLTVSCLPTHHFSGRGLSPNRTLWASYLLHTDTGRNVYIGGDGGYGAHYAAIGQRFPDIDLAIMENGQYDRAWKHIHLMPNDLEKAIRDLNPRKVLTVHHAKYALAKHRWDEPLDHISLMTEKDSLLLFSPMIGEPVYWADSVPVLSKWWDTCR